MNTDKKYWWKDATFYSLYLDKFAGNFINLTDKLSYLQNLGIDAIWLLPHYPSPMIDGGYDITDFLNVRSELGTLNDFEKFVTEAHVLDIKVIIDITLNHTSNQHIWFENASKDLRSSYRDYYIWSNTGKELLLAENPFSNIKTSNWIPNTHTNDYYFATFYPQQPDLNWENPAVLEEMLKILDFWIDMGVDGFRLDSIPRIIKEEGTSCVNLPKVHDVVRKIRKHIEKKSSETILVAENDLPINEAKKYFGNGDECHVGLNFVLGLQLWLSLMGDSQDKLQSAIDQSSGIPDSCSWATFLNNHDSHALYLLDPETKKRLSKWMDPDYKYSLKPASKTSVRVGEIFNGDKRRILSAYRKLFDLPGAHILYYGDEIGMRNLPPVAGNKDTRTYVRGDFDWEEAEKQKEDENSILTGISEITCHRSIN
ncbi:alpha-amylase [candidate division WWE3 bacterium]|uniref:Alpha-amylase n=1 Tax=candidate division WWE3 bacterium TaxID=2053526 RepID=A0A3A4ZFW0_UNCKA|nr:MAG: alpha-amylase [candidate division WWE3 bacterium]